MHTSSKGPLKIALTIALLFVLTTSNLEVEQSTPLEVTEQPLRITQQAAKYDFQGKGTVTMVVLTCCGRHDFLEKTIPALKIETYPVEKIIVVNDGVVSKQLLDVMIKFPQITWLSTGKKVGQIVAVDEAYKLIDTEYVYFTQDDFLIVRDGVIKLNIEMLKKQEKLLMCWNRFHGQEGITDENGIVRLKPGWYWDGFSFNPHVMRMKDYRNTKGGFTGITNNRSFGKGAGIMEDQISHYYKRLGFYVKQIVNTSNLNYEQHLGAERSNPKYWG